MSRRRTAGPRRGLTLDLFPALSLFVCVLGVLTLLQVILSTSMGDGVSVSVRNGDNGLTPITVVCRPEGVELRAPTGASAPNFSDAAAQETFGELTRERALLFSVGRFDAAGMGPALERLVNSTSMTNALARQHALAYEESLMVIVYPGSAACYHALHRVRSTAEGVGTRVAALPADDHWEVLP